MVQAVAPILKAMGVLLFTVNQRDDLAPVTSAALSATFKAGNASAIILSQRFLGAKQF